MATEGKKMEVLAAVLLLLAVPSKAIWEHSSKTLDGNKESCSKDLIMIRTTEPGKHMMQRFKKIEKERPDADIIFSVDYTSQNKSSMDVASSSANIQELDTIFPNSIYFFHDEDMTEKFPGLKTMRHFQEFGKGLAWGYHFEGFSVVIDKFEKRTGKKFSDYCGLWLVEDDLAFSGKWTEIMDNSIEVDGKRTRADLYALRVEYRPNDVIDNVEWYQIASPSFVERYPSDKRWTLDSYLMYYSRELFEQVNADSLEGRHAFSEMNVPTVCGYEKIGNNRDCQYKVIPAEYRDGDGYFVISSEFYHKPEEIEQRYENYMEAGVSKLLHPLKQ